MCCCDDKRFLVLVISRGLIPIISGRNLVFSDNFKKSLTTTNHTRRLLILLGKMAALFCEANNSEPSFMDLLQNNDPTMDELLAQWTHEANCNTFASETQASCGVSDSDNWNESTVISNFTISDEALTQDSAFDSLFLTPISSPHTITGAVPIAEQVNLSSYPEAPSLTAGTWVPEKNASLASHYGCSPALFGGISEPIDPTLLALEAPGFCIFATPPVLPMAQPWQSASSHPSPTLSISPSPPPKWSSTEPKERPTLGKTRVTKRTRSNPKPKPKPVPQKTSLTVPLSQLRASFDVPVRDILSHIKRPTCVRQAEAASCRGRKNQAVPRPSNSFMLYRWAYTDLIQAVARANSNHQLISGIAGESWRTETEDVREEFMQLAEMDRVEHGKAWPGYKYQPKYK